MKNECCLTKIHFTGCLKAVCISNLIDWCFFKSFRDWSLATIYSLVSVGLVNISLVGWINSSIRVIVSFSVPYHFFAEKKCSKVFLKWLSLFAAQMNFAILNMQNTVWTIFRQLLTLNWQGGWVKSRVMIYLFFSSVVVIVWEVLLCMSHLVMDLLHTQVQTVQCLTHSLKLTRIEAFFALLRPPGTPLPPITPSTISLLFLSIINSSTSNTDSVIRIGSLLGSQKLDKRNRQWKLSWPANINFSVD